MQKSSQQDQSNHSDEFKPKSLLFFCIDQNGDIGFEVQLGEKITDVKKFSSLLNKLTNGEFNETMLIEIKEQVKTISDGTKKYKIIEKALMQKGTKDLVISPTEVEINL